MTTYRTPQLSFSFRRRVLSLAVSPAVAAREMAARKSEAHTAPSTGLTVAASCCTWLGRGRGLVRAVHSTGSTVGGGQRHLRVIAPHKDEVEREHAHEENEHGAARLVRARVRVRVRARASRVE